MGSWGKLRFNQNIQKHVLWVSTLIIDCKIQFFVGKKMVALDTFEPTLNVNCPTIFDN